MAHFLSQAKYITHSDEAANRVCATVELVEAVVTPNDVRTTRLNHSPEVGSGLRKRRVDHPGLTLRRDKDDVVRIEVATINSRLGQATSRSTRRIHATLRLWCR